MLDDLRLLVADDRQVSQLGVGNRNDDVVFGEDLRISQSDVDLLILLFLDRDRLLNVVVMQTQALDRNIVLTGRDSRDVDPVLLVGTINLVNNTGARVIETVENNQYGIRMVLGIDVVKLETNGAGIHDFSRGGGAGGSRGNFPVVVVRK